MKIDKEEFERLALEHLDMLYRLACKLCRDRQRAEDLVQETYLRAFRAWSGFELKQCGIRPWLVRIMQNLHYSGLGQSRRQALPLGEEQLDMALAANRGHEQPLADFQSMELMDERVVRALDALPQEYQAVMLLWAVDEFSYREIADALEIPVGTVMSRLHRARARLSEQLRDVAKDARLIRE